MLAALDYYAFVRAKRDCVVLIDFRVINWMRTADYSTLMRESKGLLIATKIEYNESMFVAKSARKYEDVFVSVSKCLI